MIILSHTGGVARTNCFLVADEATSKAALFDAPDHTITPLLEEASRRKLDLEALWLTHGHFDHFADHAKAREKFPNLKVFIHRLDEAKAKSPERQTRIFGVPMEIPPLHADGYVEDRQKLKVGALEMEVIHTPGHSSGHVGYYFPAEHILIGGDLIIGGSVGRTDLPDSNHADLEKSIRRVMQLPPDTRLLGGHGPETTLKDERAKNWFVREALGLN
jgi:glyoxylase-like metal-dependent hydrolase (beta-lactamase superfamily II)